MTKIRDTIFLNHLTVKTLIGIHEHEKIKPQPLILSLALETDFSAAQQSDDIAEALDYARLSTFIEHFASEHQFALIETFAAHLTQQVFKHFPKTIALTLKIEKPCALSATREVGLIQYRSNPNYC